MNENTTNKIEIPRNFSASKTYNLPPIFVEIPLHAYANRSSLLLYMIIYASMVPVGLLLFLGTWNNISNSAIIDKNYFGILLMPIFVFIAVFGFLVALVCIYDALIPSPSLTIDLDYIHDRRSDAILRWESCNHAEFLTDKRGLSCVRIYINKEISTKSNFFRLGSELRFSRKATLLIPVRFLNIKPYILAQSIAVMVQKHGGTAETFRWE